MMKTFKRKTRQMPVLLAFLLYVLPLSAQKFTLPVLPDTQVEVNIKPEMFMSQMQWLADKRDSLKAPMILHVGDIVDYNNDLHYETATKGFAILDKAKIPYAVCLGNHDTDAVGENSGSAAPGNTNKNLRQTPKFNRYFPVSRFRNQKERFEENKSDNAAYVFKAGGVKWLVVSLEFCARKEPVEWANSVIEKYPKHNVIILTHLHLTANGTIDQRNAGYGDLSPQQIFDMMIKKHANVRFVLSGHTGTSTFRVDQGEHGNNIYQILQDYQGQDYGGGFIRLLEIDTKKGTVNGKMYSPYYNTTKNDYSLISFTGVKFIGKKSKSF
jgi:3',5'-cyclic AMP phosphodiesterase CpdA